MAKYTRKTEKGYPKSGEGDEPGEYSYILTECGYWWYSVRSDPMLRDGCRCPICGKIVKVEQVTERRDIYEC